MRRCWDTQRLTKLHGISVHSCSRGLVLGDLLVVNRLWATQEYTIVPERYKLDETMIVVVLCPQDFPFLQGMPFLEAGPLQAVGMSHRCSVAPWELGGSLE